MAVTTDGAPAAGPSEIGAPVAHPFDALRGTPVPSATEASPVVVSSQRQAADLPTRRVHVRVRQRFGDITQHYVGSVQIAGEPEGERQLQLDSSASVEVALAGTPLVFSAAGFEPLRWSPPIDGAATTVHDVVLEPASSLRFFVMGLPVGAHELQLTLRDATRSFPFRRMLADAAVPVEIAWCGGADVEWSLSTVSGSRLLSVGGTALGFGLAEAREVHVDCASIRMARHRLVGPSSRLLAACEVMWPSGEGKLAVLPVAVDGTFWRPATEGAELSVRTHDGSMSTVREVADDEVRCLPVERLVGVQVVAGDGRCASLRLMDDRGRLLGVESKTLVWERRKLPTQLLLRVDGEAQVFRTTSLPDDADVLVLRREDALPTTRLRVLVDGVEPLFEGCQTLQLCVCSADGSIRQQHPAMADASFTLPRGAVFGVHWLCDNQLGPEVARATVAVGECVELHIGWPVVHRWTGEVEGFQELAPPQRWHRVAFGPGDSPVAGWSLRIDANGRFVGHRFAEAEPEAAVDLVWGLCRVSAMIAQHDAERRHLVVRPADSLRWLDVTIDAPGAWRVLVMRPVFGARPRIVHVMSSGQRWPVPVVGEEQLLFVFEAQGEESTSVLAWGASSATAGPMRLAAASTRRLEVRTRATSDRSVSFVGPAGQCAGQQVVRFGEVLCVDVPFDTRGVLPWKTGDGPEPQELLIPADGVVTID